MRVAVAIPTITPQGAERATALANEISLMDDFLVVVIDNGGHVKNTHGWLRWGPHLSVAASWNTALRTNLDVSTVVLLNDDVVVTPGGLRELALASELSRQRFLNGRGPLELVAAEPHAFACFAMHPDLVAAVGYFDEEFVPAYYEDTDYLIRMGRAGVKLRTIDIGLRHDAPGTSSRELGRDWTETAKNSRAYFLRKWGSKRYPYIHPFNKAPT